MKSPNEGLPFLPNSETIAAAELLLSGVGRTPPPCANPPCTRWRRDPPPSGTTPCCYCSDAAACRNNRDCRDAGSERPWPKKIPTAGTVHCRSGALSATQTVCRRRRRGALTTNWSYRNFRLSWTGPYLSDRGSSFVSPDSSSSFYLRRWQHSRRLPRSGCGSWCLPIACSLYCSSTKRQRPFLPPPSLSPPPSSPREIYNPHHCCRH